MSYNKVYENKPIWHNDREPSINETRLNALSNATDIIDNRVIELDEKPLEDISNMQITDLQNGQGIKWNAELGKWENGIVGGNPRMTWANYQQAWERGEIEPLTVVTITDLSDSYINVVALTWQQYQALIDQGLDDDNIFYVITDRSASLDLISTEISPTKAWSSEYTNEKISAINSTLTKSYGTLTDVNSGITNLAYTLVKCANVVELSGRCTFATQTTGTKAMFKLPSGFYRNNQQFNITWYDNNKDLPCAGRITNNDVYLYSTDKNTQTSITWYFTVTYIV